MEEHTTISDIVGAIQEYSPDADLRPVMAAYMRAAMAHAGQTRKTGEPYLTHPLAVAHILTELKMDTDTIAAALLHDALEDNPITSKEIVDEVGPVITSLVKGVTKIGKLRFRSKEELAAENFRKMMLAMSQDLRVILIKLADRTHNLRTIDGHKPEKARMIATETMEVYAPIANRLGINRLKDELEDTCFRALYPEAYWQIVEFLEATAADRARFIDSFSSELQALLTKHGLTVEVSGRAKSPWSIFKKMQRQGCAVEEVHDRLAFRVVTKNVGECYSVLGLVHSEYAPIPGRIKDYIARPKPNGYQSLHTTVVGPSGRMEIQVRTEEMHRVSEEGIAAHWRYKEGRLALSRDDMANISKIRDLFEHAAEAESASDFMEALKFEFYAEEVFVFTPNGDIRKFPLGATALDFAYAVHTRVGEQCTGARIDGRMVPIRYELQNGDSVEIITTKNQKPNRDWLSIAKTGRAIQKIRRFLRNEEREVGIRIGREMVENELKRLGTNLAAARSAKALAGALTSLELNEPDDLFIEVARGHVGLAQVVRLLVGDESWKPRGDAPQGISSVFGRWAKRSESPVLITGEDGLLVHFAQCCQPLPGEQVEGYITRGRGITVHRHDCEQLLRHEVDRRVPVEWDRKHAGQHTGELRLVCVDRPGVLADISKVCEQAKVNISRVEAQPVGDNRSICTLAVSVVGVQQLTTLVANLKRVRSVESVERA